MIGWLAIIIGILVLLGICWYHRKTIRSFFVKNKKKISAVAVAGGMIGVGGSAILTDTDFIIPEGYRPNTATMITNSNGRYWAATGANIQVAIDDCNNVSGSLVKLAGGTTYTVTSTILTWYNMTLDLQGSTICPDSDFDVVNVNISSKLMNGRIDVSDVGSFSSNAVTILPALNSASEPTWRKRYDTCEVSTGVYDMVLISTSQQGTGVNLSIGGGNSHIYFVDIHNIFTKSFHTGYHLNSYVDGGGCNGNTFSDLYSYDETYGIHILDTGTSEVAGNYVNGFQYQAYDGTNTYAVYIEGGHGNIIDNLIIWDWGTKGDSTHCVKITSGSVGNMIQSTYGVDIDTIADAGTSTVIIDDDMAFTNLLRMYNASDYGVLKSTSEASGFKIEADNGNIFLAYESASPVSCYESADNGEHVPFSVWGNSGSLENINFRWEDGGIIDTSVGGGGLIFTPDNGYVDITGTLNVSTKFNCVGLSFLSQLMVDGTTPRWINDSFDNLDTRIRNSNGNSWAATGDNIQLAIDNAGSNSWVKIPPGNYSTEFAINNDNVIVSGSGNGTIIIRTNNPGDNAAINIGGSNCILENMQVDGDYINDTSLTFGDHCISIENCEKTTVRTVYAHDSMMSNIIIQHTASDITIENCYLENTRNTSVWPGGVKVEGDSCRIINNNIKNHHACGIVVEKSGDIGERTVISGNIISNSTHGIHCEASTSDNIIIDSNIIFDCKNLTYVYDEAVGIYCDNGIISNNIISNIQGKGILAYGNCSVDGNKINGTYGYNAIGIHCLTNNGNAGTLVSDNTLENIGNEGIRCYLLDKGVNICNNRLYNTTSNTSNDVYAIKIISCESPKITDNTIIYADKFVSSSNVGTVVSDNTFIGGAGSDYLISLFNDDVIVTGNNITIMSASKYAVYVGDNSIVSMNRIVGNNYLSNGIYVNGASNVVISGNIINGTNAAGGQFPHAGIWINNEGENCSISNNRIFGCVVGMFIKGYNISITDNNLNGCPRGIDTDGTVKDCFISGNNVQDCITDPIDVKFLLPSCIIKDNPGYDNSTYEYIPCSGSSPYTSPSDGATYFCTTNQTMAVYWTGKWWYSASYT